MLVGVSFNQIIRSRGRGFKRRVHFLSPSFPATTSLTPMAEVQYQGDYSSNERLRPAYTDPGDGEFPYYVVWEGRDVGIFNSWCARVLDGPAHVFHILISPLRPQAHKSVHKFPGNLYQGAKDWKTAEVVWAEYFGALPLALPSPVVCCSAPTPPRTILPTQSPPTSPRARSGTPARASRGSSGRRA